MALASCYELFQRRGRKALHDLKMLILKACISAYLSDDALTEISPHHEVPLKAPRIVVQS